MQYDNTISKIKKYRKMRELSKIVSVFRAYYGYSQKELSKICKCHRTTILSIEKTPWRTRQTTAKKLTSILKNKGITFLADEGGEMFIFQKRSNDAVQQH